MCECGIHKFTICGITKTWRNTERERWNTLNIFTFASTYTIITQINSETYPYCQQFGLGIEWKCAQCASVFLRCKITITFTQPHFAAGYSFNFDTVSIRLKRYKQTPKYHLCEYNSFASNIFGSLGLGFYHLSQRVWKTYIKVRTWLCSFVDTHETISIAYWNI